MDETPAWSPLDSVPRLKLHQGPPPEHSTPLPFVHASAKEQIANAVDDDEVGNVIDKVSEKLLIKAGEFFADTEAENIHIYNLKMNVNWTYRFTMPLKNVVHVTMSGTPALLKKEV